MARDNELYQNREHLSYKLSDWSEDLDKLVQGMRRWKCRNKYWEQARDVAGTLNIYVRPPKAEAVYSDLKDIYITRFKKKLLFEADPSKEYISLPSKNIFSAHETTMRTLQRYVHIRAKLLEKEDGLVENNSALYAPRSNVLEDTTLVYVPSYTVEKPTPRVIPDFLR